MQRQKPDDSLDTSNMSRSLGIALGVQDFMFIAGILLLAVGLFFCFGWGEAALGVGLALLVTAWTMQFVK